MGDIARGFTDTCIGGTLSGCLLVIAVVACARKSQLFVKARRRDVININVTLDETSRGEGIVVVTQRPDRCAPPAEAQDAGDT